MGSRTDMRVIPECSRLVLRVEIIEKGLVGCDWALTDKGCSVRPVCRILEYPMPVLRN